MHCVTMKSYKIAALLLSSEEDIAITQWGDAHGLTWLEHDRGALVSQVQRSSGSELWGEWLLWLRRKENQNMSHTSKEK